MAKYPKCPQCGAIGCVGSTFPPCACSYRDGGPAVRLRKDEGQAVEANLCPHCGKDTSTPVNWFAGERPDGVLTFDGPPTAICFGFPYAMVGTFRSGCDGGVYPMHETRGEAIEAFNRKFSLWAEGADQIAWRRRPSVTQTPAGFYADARALRYPSEREEP